MNCYLFTSEPAGPVYAELIHFCCERASEMILVRREAAMPRSLELRSVFAKLSAFQTKAVLATRWPGTLLFADQALVHHYRVDAELGARVLGLSSALFDWSHAREYPEDLSFLRADGKPLLVNTVHERDACLYLTDAELAGFQRAHPALMAILRFEGKTPHAAY